MVGAFGSWCAIAQTDTGTPDTTGPKPAYTIQDETPATQPGPKPAFTYPDTTPSLDFLTGSIENSSIKLGIGAGLAFDSNGYPSSTTNSNQDRILFTVAPSISIQQFFPRFSWHVSYAAGLQVYNQIVGPSNTNSRQLYQSIGGGFIWQFTHHWQMLADENYRYSANPFDSFLTIPGTPAANNPNAVSYIPLTNFTQNRAILTLTNQITKRDTISFSGTETYRHTSRYNVVSAVPFYNLVSYGGRANYAHELSPRLKLGAGYDYNSLDFGRGVQRSGIQTVTFTVDYLLRPNMTITAWVGPQYTSTKTLVPVVLPTIPPTIVVITKYDSQWNTAVGGNFGWQSQRNSIRAGFSRSVSDGGGIIATSVVNTVNGSYRRQLTHKWSGTVGARYLNSTSTTDPNRYFHNFFADVTVDYALNKSFQLNATYLRVHQTQSNSILINPGTYNDNRVGVNVSYHWTHPLGR
jgi:hypothetical protein